jgi:predicted RNA binding protein YcfA (HicA-like mRNA interferase family)
MASPVRFAKVRKQLEAAGYRLVRISSSHHIFERPGKPIVSIPVHNNQVKPFYARQVERIVAADKAAEGGSGKAGEGGEGPKSRGK